MILDLDAFRSWLEKDPERKFKPSATCECPLACYAREELKLFAAEVDGYGVHWIADDKFMSEKLPEWAVTFVELYDVHEERWGALEALEGALSELALDHALAALGENPPPNRPE